MDWAPKRPVPVFPLPGVVLFPNGEMSLRVFELRYRTMVRDALSSAALPAVEVHISDIKKREEFRHHSMTAGACRAMISGKGFPGYIEALQRLAEL